MTNVIKSAIEEQTGYDAHVTKDGDLYRVTVEAPSSEYEAIEEILTDLASKHNLAFTLKVDPGKAYLFWDQD